MRGVDQYKVKLLPHDPLWAEEFNKTKALIQALWKDNVVEIQHFGSTAIRGIAAKPILDVAAVLKSFAGMDIEAMERAGYEYGGLREPDNDRHFFMLRGENGISLHHIHCYEPDNVDFKRCVGFRDYLNAHPEEAETYSELKAELARRYPEDRFAYSDGKIEFIQSVYRKLGL